MENKTELLLKKSFLLQGVVLIQSSTLHDADSLKKRIKSAVEYLHMDDENCSLAKGEEVVTLDTLQTQTVKEAIEDSRNGNAGRGDEYSVKGSDCLYVLLTTVTQ